MLVWEYVGGKGMLFMFTASQHSHSRNKELLCVNWVEGWVGGEVWVIVCEEDALHTRTLWWPRVHTTTSLAKQDNKM